MPNVPTGGMWIRNEAGDRELRDISSGLRRERTCGSRYRSQYIDTFGQPDLCVCGASFDQFEFVIHHIDGNHWDHVLPNLVALCRSCHARTHHLGRVDSDETIERRRQSLIASWARLSKEERVRRLALLAEVGKRSKGVARSSQFREAQRLAQSTSRMRECECGMKTNAGAMGRHVRSSGHALAQ